MPSLKTFATLGALATVSVAVPIQPLLANPFGTIVPAPLGADKDGEHPTVVVDTRKVMSGGKECKVWHLGQDGVNITPECRQWVADADDSTSNHYIVEIQTVKLADENAVCEKWHVESHEDIISPVCGEIKKEPGFGTSTLDDAVREVKIGTIAGRDAATSPTTSAEAATAQRAIDTLLHIRARKAEDGPDVAVSLEVNTRPAAERLADLVAILEPLPYLSEILPMTATITKMVPGAAIILARMKDSPILQRIATEPEKTFVREVTALGTLFADPHAFLETAKQARASIAAGNLTITEPTFANLLSGYHNLTSRATVDDLPRIVTDATYAAEVMTELETQVAAHGVNDDRNHDGKPQRRITPMWPLMVGAMLVPSLWAV
ncbi:hypothetical protein LTR86_010663 [Recurvomyces mirabilis]|nr:hypothetical protein LTR86_010663 [Recurvomyces mirabilis]